MLASLPTVQSYLSDRCSLDGAVSQYGEVIDGGLVHRVGQAHQEGDHGSVLALCSHTVIHTLTLLGVNQIISIREPLEDKLDFPCFRPLFQQGADCIYKMYFIITYRYFHPVTSK